MTYANFKTQIKNVILSYLPEEFANATVEIQTITKTNDERKDGLIVRKPNVNIAPTIYLKEIYKADTPFSDKIKEIADAIVEFSMDTDFPMETIYDFEKVKDKILPRLLNANRNGNLKANCPHKILNNELMLVYTVQLTREASTMITRQLMYMWNIDLTQLDAIAKANLKPKFSNIEDFLFGINPELDVEFVNESKMIWVVSNATTTYGAANVLCRPVMETVRENIGDFYILPSSVHEMILSAKLNGSADDFRNLVREVNNAMISPTDFLSNEIFEYDFEADTLKEVA